MLALSIASPCREKRENMIPVEQGVYCGSCCKNVIDFSNMPDEEIVRYFQKKKSEPVCGRFRRDQLNRPLIEIPPSIFMMEIPFWKKFLAALFIYFSSFITGCTNKEAKDYTGAEAPPTIYATPKQDTLKEGNEQSSGKPKTQFEKVSDQNHQLLTEDISVLIDGYVTPYEKQPPFPNLHQIKE